MRVGFSGAFSVGKTTLAANVAKEFGIENLTEPVRQIEESGKKITDLSTESLYLMQWLFAKHMLRRHVDTESFVCDATIADTLAYSDSIPEYRHLVETAKDCAKAMYDVVFYVPIEFPIEDDGFRHLDESYREAIDNKIKSLHSELGIETVTVSGTLEERMEKVRSTLLALTKK